MGAYVMTYIYTGYTIYTKCIHVPQMGAYVMGYINTQVIQYTSSVYMYSKWCLCNDAYVHTGYTIYI